MKKIFAHHAVALVVTGCAQQAKNSDSGTTTAAAAAMIDSAVYADAVTNPNRPEADRERDFGREPTEVLEFFGIAPGMVVLDMFSGGGYYTEIMSSVNSSSPPKFAVRPIDSY